MNGRGKQGSVCLDKGRFTPSRAIYISREDITIYIVDVYTGKRKPFIDLAEVTGISRLSGPDLSCTMKIVVNNDRIVYITTEDVRDCGEWVAHIV